MDSPSPPHHPQSSTSTIYLQTARLFQSLAATFHDVPSIYDFATHLLTALLAAGILFTLVVQSRLRAEAVSKAFAVRYEALKALQAELLWTGWLLDALLVSREGHERPVRVAAVGVSFVLVGLLFYPTVIYAVLDLQRERRTAQSGSGEQSALLPAEERDA
ncbi:hypothetical protein LTR62_006383 [Meristemomyces frigidus]|uniref:Uncharacterized protein n=1 Tax=Meristemomyces frigidus TaxID=1508187 RepID=A0AAN7TC69_9PEZI|nr:hypothetical protein LTR62_006383 [Meristemomyces frigidus]